MNKWSEQDSYTVKVGGSSPSVSTKEKTNEKVKRISLE